jgi:hypothetical protein
MSIVKRTGLFFTCVLFLACGGGPAPVQATAPAPAVSAAPADELGAAIRETSDYLNKQLPKGNKLVILNVQSDFPALSEYIIDELIANTVNDRVFSVVDRQQLNTIRAELDFQMSGEVDDDTAQTLGRMAGAQIIVSGAVSKIGDLYRLRVRALSVQTAAIEGQFNRNIPDGPVIAALVKSEATGYGGGATAAKPAGQASAGSPVSASALDIVAQVLGSPAQNAQNPAAPVQMPVKEEPNVYRIGDAGPAGGLIFYDKGDNTDGWRYLEAAPKDAGTAKWSAGGNPLSRTSTEVGMGKWNTDYIERYLRGNGESNCAAQLCLSYSQGGYRDWFLPSKDELNLMYTNLELKNMGGFSVGWYWSSSQSHEDGAWCQRFSDGVQYSDGSWGRTAAKSHSYPVRAVRQF